MWPATNGPPTRTRSTPLSAEFPGLRPELLRAAEYLVRVGRQYGPVRVTSAYRDYKTQLDLYLRWMAGQSPYPAAPPGHSMHELGRAFDLKADPRLLAYLGQLWQSWGGTYGAKFGDPIHFEY